MRTLLGSICLFFCLSATPGQSLADWSPDFAPPGPPGLSPRAVIWWNDLVVVAGNAGRSSAPVQSFDGESWADLGELEGTVEALAIWQGLLVAAGSLDPGDDRYRSTGLATWDGQQWTPWPAATPRYIEALSVRDHALYVGGSFETCEEDTLNHIAVWRDGGWHPLGSGVGQASSPAVRALAWHDGSLYAGGRFNVAGSEQALCVARWDGERWHRLGDGVFGDVNALQSYRGRLYVGGEFVDAGGDTVAGLAAWDGANWSRIGEGLRPRGRSSSISVNHLVEWDGELVVGGLFQTTGSGIENLAGWDGSEWSSFPGEARMGQGPEVLWSHDGMLFVGAERPLSYVPEESRLVAWDGVRWTRVGGGGRKIDPYEEDLRGRDDYLRRTGTPLLTSDMKARAEEHGWPRIRLVTVWREDIVAFVGRSNRPDSHPAMVVAWRDGDWEAMVEFPYRAHSNVDRILSTPESLVFLGTFQETEDAPAFDACAWDGRSWTALGTGRHRWRLSASAVWRGHAVVAMDSVSRRRTSRKDCVLIADDSGWRELSVPWQGVGALREWRDCLIAAVWVEPDDEAGYYRLESWNGAETEPLPGRIRGSVNDMIPYDGTLVVTGFFSAIDSLSCGKIAYLRDGVWLPLGEGLEGLPKSLAATDGQLWIGGRIERAGPHPSEPIARWDGPLPRNVDLSSMPRVDPPRKPSPEGRESIVDGWHSHGIDSLRPAGAFANGDLRDWDEAGPVGWTVFAQSRHGRERVDHPPERVDGGGIRLTLPEEKGRLRLSRRIAARPGQAYQARVRIRVADPDGAGRTRRAFVSLSDYIRRDSGHEYGPLHGGIGVTVADTSWTWAEVTLVTGEGANVCVVSVASRSQPMSIEVDEVEFDEVEVTSADVVEELLMHLEKRYVHPQGEDVDWPAIRAEFGQQAAETPVSESLSLVRGVLDKLPPAGVAYAVLEADVHHYSSFGDMGGRPDSTHARDGRRISRTRDELASSMVFSSELGHRSRDGLLLLRNAESLSRTDRDGVRGVLLDLRSASRGALGNRYGTGRDWTEEPPWKGLAPWSDGPVPFALKHDRQLHGTSVDTLVTPESAGDTLRLPLVVLIDQTTTGPAALTAMAASVMKDVVLIGLPSGAPYWRSSWIPLACGAQAHFPTAWITWPDGPDVRGERTVRPLITVPDPTDTRDGVDPILEAGLETLRALVDEGS